MAKRVAELEKSLGEAQERERTRDDLEKTQVEHLLTLADAIGSKYLGSLPTLLFVDCGNLTGVDFFWSRNLRRCPSRRNFRCLCRLDRGCWLHRPRLRVCLDGAVEVDRRFGDCAPEHLPQPATAGRR